MHELRDAPGATPLRFATPDTRFGDGVVTELGAVLDRYGVSDPLFVTDRGVEEAGLLDIAVDAVDVTPATYYASREPSTDDVDDLPTEEVDGVVAIGGGSCLDTAKLAAVLLAHGGHPSEYVGVDRVPGPIAPLVAVPTTSGTGSQATQTAVVSHDGVKRGASDEHLRPDVALVDPELTFGLPRNVTARSGFDAFVHAMESLLAREYRWVEERPITYQGANPVSRCLARRALVLVHGSLERAVFDGDDRDARRAMSLGSHLAGTAFSASGLGAVHALASTLGGMTGRPHGECLAAAIRAGLTYNLPVRHDEYSVVAHELGGGGDGASNTPSGALVAECERLRDSIGLPGSFAEVGVSRSDIDTIVENTLVQERRLATNPRTVTDDLREFLLDGELHG
ncbi:iron-containing alcohol dehydrogenase [Halalkalicoccus sp. NIPERK01]|uniref:iron-containing alcohol dehydrogenase n=1 Tax=Halalkalicoccus sp. NIPERK01 TaxID=3053469 RepID=UPI00256EB5A9|nr:iron-containing alcohol dehydrogenase [Halalkalicoccus sp. NIPERK01]MDL5361677.1 iron-containing alcohol dehydrogenase [Halalkalicoccus sp. NIPERK01]